MSFTASHSSLDLADRNVARPDTDLLTKARAGSSAAFEEIQRSYASRLYRRIHSITRNREDAEDALQDTFLRAFSALDSFQGRSQLSTWLMRIAINTAVMTIRRRRSQAEVSFEQSSESGGATASFDIIDSAPNPEQICDRNQRYGKLLRSVERLEPKLRSAVVVWISHDCSMKEVAQSLDVSLATVKARIHRARKRLSRFPA
jgi:RNA polymerase sigma-70 factor (ECF subfamily)